jgi:NADH-quinone oxidoreductase subunit L
MDLLLKVFIIIPFIGFTISMILPKNNEQLISWTAFFTTGIQLFFVLGFIGIWISKGFPTLNEKDLELFKTKDYVFFIDFYFDKITAVYLLVGSFLSFIVAVYSRAYMHREEGYKRFFNTKLFFFFGYCLTVISGNMETLFVGWEILGISSFLLIAFYRNRYLPVKNAVKVFSIYRIGDIGLLLAMWMSHHLFHENITFLKLTNYQLVSEHLNEHSFIGVFISMVILLSATAKSAQFPFSSWLPRAMEGPTPSSAIFYGSLAVHIGVFLLLRTHVFWEHQYTVRVFIGLLGLTSALIATGIARVQSSVKSQIAYFSIGQIGIIFIELALGLDNLALFHFATNALLRTYQLLVSPSVVSNLILEQFYNFSPHAHSLEYKYPSKIRNTLYLLCLQEWNLDSIMYQYLWNPMKTISKRLYFVKFEHIVAFFAIVYSIGLYCLVNTDALPFDLPKSSPTLFAFIGLAMVLKAFSERRRVRMAWWLVVMNHFWIALTIAYNENVEPKEMMMYLGGVIVSALVGHWCILRLKKQENIVSLTQFNGHIKKHPKIAGTFLLACLGLTGFPITPTFIGEDLVFSHIHSDQIFLALFVSMSLIIDGLAIIRIYARLFLGPHVKSMYEMGYRAS